MAARASCSSIRPADKFLHWVALRPGVALALAVLAALGPFIAKPFNFDDPLFIGTARQIQVHPANPYGFDLNWYGTVSPMWKITKNPPLACYYLALVATVLGWSEAALHFAFLLPAVAAILGTYRLALHFCGRPLFAAGATLFTPVFLVSSTTLMCDTMLLAFWVWAIVLWIEGVERKKNWWRAGSVILITLAALTKYYGASLIPLLAAYSFISRRRLGWWTGCFLIPVAVLVAYQWVTGALYGKGLLSDAGDYATRWFVNRAPGGTIGLIALAYTGGCLALATFLAPLLWRARTLAMFAAGAALFAAAIFMDGTLLKKYDTPPTFPVVQIIFWAVGGMSILGLAVADTWHRRDARSCLLALWVLGTFLFAGFFNWTVNGRSILPMAPAVGILLARRLEQRARAGKIIWQGGVNICLAAGAVLAFGVAAADFQLAKAVRRSAEQTHAKYGRGEKTLWFEGHWGFQYYMERLGAKAVDMKHSVTKRDDFLAIPSNNTNVKLPNKQETLSLEAVSIQGPRWVTTTGMAAGYYTSVSGFLPFAFGHVPPEKVLMFAIRPTPPASQEEQP